MFKGRRFNIIIKNSNIVKFGFVNTQFSSSDHWMHVISNGIIVDGSREHSTTFKDRVGELQEGGLTPTTSEEETREKEVVHRRQK